MMNRWGTSAFIVGTVAPASYAIFAFADFNSIKATGFTFGLAGIIVIALLGKKSYKNLNNKIEETDNPTLTLSYTKIKTLGGIGIIMWLSGVLVNNLEALLAAMMIYMASQIAVTPLELKSINSKTPEK